MHMFMYVSINLLANVYIYTYIYIYQQMSDERKTCTFQYSAWLIGILIMVYHNPHITG